MKLNLGAGNCPLDDREWINMDAKTGDSLFPLIRHCCAIPEHDPIPCPDNAYDTVRASHCLEHFSHAQTLDVLKEWTRVLKPGGWLKIAVPDFDWIWGQRYDKQERGKSDVSLGMLEAYLFGGQVDENDYHKALFTNKKLYELLQSVGLTNIQSWTSEIQDCASLPVSLNLMGQKPEAKVEVATKSPIIRTQVFAAGRWQDLDGEVQCATQEEVDAANAGQLQTRTIVLGEKRAARVALCMSTPRIGFLRPLERLLAVMHGAGVSVFTGDGVFWSHALSRSIKNACEFYFEDSGEGFDFILTADYDTYASADDLQSLITLLGRSPEADCIVPLQMKRGGTGEILAGGENMNLTQSLVPIKTGHFGFTLFRKEFFERLPRPWFYEKPDADGHWGEGRIDADIGFWLNAQKAKLNVMLAPGIVVGHGEELVVYPRIVNGKPEKVYQAVNDWLGAKVKPEGIGVR